MAGFKDLEIYQTSKYLAVKVHRLSLELPKFEKYEIGSQIRRSSISIAGNIAEGYGRQKYKEEFLRFLHFAQGSCNETESYVEILSEIYPNLHDLITVDQEYKKLGRRIANFIKYVQLNWQRKK